MSDDSFLQSAVCYATLKAVVLKSSLKCKTTPDIQNVRKGEKTVISKMNISQNVYHLSTKLQFAKKDVHAMSPL